MIADNAKLQQWVEDCVEDSDFVRVLSVLPRAGTNQLIPFDVVAFAQQNKAEHYDQASKKLGADVAQQGDDRSKIRFR